MLVKDIIINAKTILGNASNAIESKCRFYLNIVIDEINAEFGFDDASKFPSISTDSSESDTYTAFADSLIRTVLCYGLAAKLLEEDDEFESQYQAFRNMYAKALANWKRQAHSVLDAPGYMADTEQKIYTAKGMVETEQLLKTTVDTANLKFGDTYLVGKTDASKVDLWVWTEAGWYLLLHIFGRGAYLAYL